MTFEEILDQARAMLQRQGRISYRALKRQFALDDTSFEDLKEALIYAHPEVIDDSGRGLIWSSNAEAPSAHDLASAQPYPRAAERRQLTVLFCDVVDSSVLARQLDPEDYLEAVRAYQAACVEIIQRYDGYMAQYLGDGLLVYFGYPQAHEDDAQRAVRAGLEILEAIVPLRTRLAEDKAVWLAVRLAIHTGLAVVGTVGAGGRQEVLALGDTPMVAARLQDLAAPDTVIVSDATWRLVQGYFAGRDLGQQTLKGMTTPVRAYQVLGPSEAQSRLEAVNPRGLTPLVGREEEVALLWELWEHAKAGRGQVVVLSGEAGIGKTRLVRVLQDRLADTPYTRLECRCSPYTQHSAFYPLINLGRRLLQWQRDEAPNVTLGKLEVALAPYDVPLPEVVPLLASLLSLPLHDRYPPLQLTPQRQKQKTLETLLALLLAHAAQQPVLFVVEDLQWVDPSTLELLSLIIDRGPQARLLTLLTCRPEFHPPWDFGGHVASLTLGRLPLPQVEQMIDRVTGGKRLPAEVRQQVVTKTDGVPLFVEELTKMVLESGLLQERADHYELRGPLHSLAIPATLHDSLMARLDRLADAKEVAQLGATIGRAFPYKLLQAVSPWDEDRLQDALARLVEAGLLYQRGGPPHVMYVFKHALVQETAYQSLLKSTRQRYHRQIVRVLEQRFPEIATTQPEWLAHHYTEAGLPAQALPYWLQAGQRAVERSANVEAISHFTKGLDLLKALPATPERVQQELILHLAMGSPLLMLKGHTAPEVEQTYARAYDLAQQLGDTPQRFSVLVGVWRFYLSQARLHTARELAEQCFALAQHLQDPTSLQEAHTYLGSTFFFMGDPGTALTHLEQGIALYDPEQSHTLAFSRGTDPGVVCLSRAAWVLWWLGYPDQALARSQEAVALAQRLSHPYSLYFALQYDAFLHMWRREASSAKERLEAVMALIREKGFIQFLGGGMTRLGWLLIEQGVIEEGFAHIRQGLDAYRINGVELGLTDSLAIFAHACGKAGRGEEGLRVLAKALEIAHKNTELYCEPELYRLKGTLLLQADLHHLESDVYAPHTEEAEACFHQAITLARQQGAKSLELRAVMSLSRLWQRQGKRIEAWQKLAEIYNWFTEGFETLDLQEAKILLEALQ
jgi:class 3 adenylate cyclase/tetratricopeptide (TPR) repeat protein